MDPKRPSDIFTLQFSAASSIDPTSGRLLGVTVAEIGVATGHFCFVDRDNKILGVGGYDEAPQATARRLPICADEKTILSIVACSAPNKRVKTREDHDDSITARAGYADNFRSEEGKAVCDLSILDAYRNRALFLETATKTPELIGLSGDFKFNAEIIGENAFMRVGRIDAVDIVDKGALTHAGLFRALPVDTKNNEVAEHQIRTMAKTAVPDSEIPDVDAFKTMCDAYAAHIKGSSDLAAKVHAAMAAILPVNVPTPAGAPAPDGGKPGNPNASVPDAGANFAALEAKVGELTLKLSALEESSKAAVKAEFVELSKQFAALGIKPGATPAAGAAATPDLNKPAAPVEFLALSAHIAKERSISLTQAHRAVMKEKPEVHAAYLLNLGITKPKAA